MSNTALNRPVMGAWSGRAVASLSIALGLCVAIVWYFHDRFWWPVDDGVYAYVAQRLNAGDVLHRDLIDLHGGYVNFLHALAFRIFGEDLLSLRYPLAALTIIQAVLAALLLAPKGPWPAAVAALVATAFSFIQFLNPSANWYALFLFFLTAWVMTRVDLAQVVDVMLVGALIGFCFLFRQLSGVFLAMGVLAWMLLRLPQAAVGRPFLARGLLIVMALGMSGYLWSKGSLGGFFFIGMWPLAALLMALRHVRAADVTVVRLVVRLAAGACLSATPLVLYHFLSGSFGAWLHDIFLTAFLIHEQDFIARASFSMVAIGGLLGLTHWSEPSLFLNGLFWLALIAAPMLLGGLVLWTSIRRDMATALHPLPFMAPFFAVVALHYQIPIYLFFATAPVLLGLLLLGQVHNGRTATSALLLLAVIGLVYQAGQPLSRSLAGIVRGERVALDAPEGLPRASLKMERADQEIYRRLLDRIAREAGPHEALFALPMDPELNFLTGRPSPVGYFGTPLGLRREADVGDTMARLEQAAPLFVIYRRDDKYLTPLTADLLARIRKLDPSPETFGPFDLYRLSAQTAPGAARIGRE